MTKQLAYLEKLIVFIMVALLILWAGPGFVAIRANAQEPAWSEPVLLSAPPQNKSAWFPDVAVDKAGRIHVVFSSYVKTDRGDLYDTVNYMTSLDGKEWGDIIDIAAPELGWGEATRPTLYTDSHGILHMAYRGMNVYYSHSTISVAALPDQWSSPSQMNVDQVAYFTRMAADKQGRLHLVFTENVVTPQCPICYHVFYRWSDNNGFTWSAITEISKIPIGAAKPQIIIDEQDNLHVVWEAGIGGAYGQLSGPTQIMYAASYDGGKTWSNPLEFIVPGNDGKNITIGRDKNGKLIVAWLAVLENLVYYQSSSDQGRSWSPPRPIPGIWGANLVYGSRLDSYAMATDSAGNIHLVLVGVLDPNQKGSLNVLHLTWNGITWLQPQIIATFYGDAPEWPRIAIGNGNQLHAVWFVRDEAHIWESDKQEYQIWYAHGETDAPAVASVIEPTPIPTFTPTPTPTLTPTPIPQPTPTLDPMIRQIGFLPEASASIYTDHDDILLLTQSLLPALLVVVVVVIVARAWRQ